MWRDKLAGKYSMQLTRRLLTDSDFVHRIGTLADLNKRTLVQEIASQSYDMADAMVKECEARNSKADDDLPY